MTQGVLVTGGAKRIGAAIARRFAADGVPVVVHYHNSGEEAEALAAELDAHALSFDIADRAEGVARAVELCPALDTLVLNASLFEPDRAFDDAGAFERLVSVNLAGNLGLVRDFLRVTETGRPRTVVFLLDQKLANLNPDFFSYTLSKAALSYALRMMAMEAPGDRFYGVAPGLAQPSHDQTDEEFAKSATMNLLRRRTTPEEIADAVRFAASGELRSGSVLFADSGQHLLSQPRDVMYQVRSAA